MDELLQQIIKEKVYSNGGVYRHHSIPQIIKVKEKKTIVDIENNFFFLMNKNFNTLPVGCEVVISGSDSVVTINPQSYTDLELIKHTSFRDYIMVEIFNYPTDVVTPFNLEFLKIVPIFKEN